MANFVNSICAVFGYSVLSCSVLWPTSNVSLNRQAAEEKNPLLNTSDPSLVTEIAEHGYQAKAKNETFKGRDDIMEKLQQYAMSLE